MFSFSVQHLQLFGHNVNLVDHMKLPDSKAAWSFTKVSQISVSSLIQSLHPSIQQEYLQDENYHFFSFNLKLHLSTDRSSPSKQHRQVSCRAHNTAVTADILHERSNWFQLFHAVELQKEYDSPLLSVCLPLPKRHLD